MFPQSHFKKGNAVPGNLIKTEKKDVLIVINNLQTILNRKQTNIKEEALPLTASVLSGSSSLVYNNRGGAAPVPECDLKKSSSEIRRHLLPFQNFLIVNKHLHNSSPVVAGFNVSSQTP
jgi:hypothetical protein